MDVYKCNDFFFAKVLFKVLFQANQSKLFEIFNILLFFSNLSQFFLIEIMYLVH